MSANFENSDSENSDGFVVTGTPNQVCSEISPLSAEKLTKVREWLEPTAYDISGGEYRKHASSHLLGTGSWLTASSEYQQWLTSRDHGLLWIKGIPGSGKSVMAAKIIAELTASDTKSPVLYFFFRQIIAANHKPAALLRDWMDQLLEHSPVLQRQLYSYVKAGRSLESVSQDDMWKDLKMAFASLPERVFCVTDALDEMDTGNDTFLKALATLGHWQPDKVKVLITSRPVPSVEPPLHLIPCLKVRLQEEEVDNDIGCFVMHSLETSQIDKKYWPAILNAVPGNANGLFLYARLAMDALLEPDADVEGALTHLPTDLNALYASLLREHIARSGVDDEVHRLIFQAVTHATRPLRLLEIAEMLSVVDGDRNLKSRKVLVKAACGPLLEILADETVSVIHHSFTEYLKGVTRSKDEPGYPVLDSGAAHEQLAVNCLHYLQSGSLGTFPAELLEETLGVSYYSGILGETTIAFWQRYPFLKYATRNWFKHVVAACTASSNDTKVLPETCQFLEDNHLRRVWCCLHRERSGWDIPKAHLAAKLGLTGYIKELISRNEDVDCLDGEGRTPLSWAAGEGHADAVQALILAGAKSDRAETIYGYTPLHQAARENHFLVVDILLRAGVSPMIRTAPRSAFGNSDHSQLGAGECPLEFACTRGHLETLDLMLKYITDIKNIHRALAWAACRGRSRLVSLLLEYPGVDLDTMVHGCTFLYLACSSLSIETVNILLRAGADATALSFGDQYPLNVDKPTGEPTESCLRGMIEHCELSSSIANPKYMANLERLFSSLFVAGLDVNQRDRRGYTLLHCTLLHRATQSAEIVHMLVSAGADARAVTRCRNTPLHFISNPAAISTLVEDGGADVNAVNRDGQTPLHLAESQVIMLKLLEYGSNPNILDNDGNSPLHRFLTPSYPARYLYHVVLLLRFGADPNLKNHCGLTPLRYIRNMHNVSSIVDCLIQAGADIDARDNDGRTGLFDAVNLRSHISREHVCNLEYLVDAGASKKSRDFQGRSISHEVIKGVMSQYDVDEVVQWLDVLDKLELLDLEAVDNAGNTLLHEFCSRVRNTHERLPVDMHLIRFLTGAGVDISRKNHAGQTPLHILCSRPYQVGGSWFSFDYPIVYAIHKSENIDDRDADGNTALHVASVYEQSWCKLLLDSGADPTIRNHEGMTPLHLAARCKQSNILGMLLKAIHGRLGDTPSEEADLINATLVRGFPDDLFDITALFYACQSGRPESVKLLLDAGADPNIGNLFVACAMMEQENSLWTAAKLDSGTTMAALRYSDNTRPPRQGPSHQANMFHPFASTRLEEILDMLVSAGAKLSLLSSDTSSRGLNPFQKAADLHSGYAYKCLKAIKSKHAAEMEDTADTATYLGRDPQQALRLFDDRTVDFDDRASKSMVEQSGWLEPEGINVEIFCAIIFRRQYHLVEQMVEAGCRFLVPGIGHLKYLITNGHAYLFDQIAEAETRARLGEGEWHAFGDPTKPGLHFQPKPKQDGQTENDRYETEVRNNMLEWAVGRALPNMEIVQLLVGKYAVDVNCGYEDGDTALHMIARGRHWWQVTQALPYLLQSGADIECRNLAGETPLHIALNKEYLALGGICAFHKDVAEALINAGADINAVDSKGRSCLDLAGYSTELVDLLINNGAAIRSSSIFAALKADNGAALETLLRGGADANSCMPFVAERRRRRDSRIIFDTTLIHQHEIVPLYYIASKSTFPSDADTRSCFRKLLSHGADIYATFQGRPRGEAFASADSGDYNKLLGIAEENTPEQRSVLHELVRLGKLSKCILDAVDIDASSLDPKGCTLLHAACESWNGPDGLVDMTSDDKGGGDAEDADQMKVEGITAFQKLMALGCDIQARDNSGQSIVHGMIYHGSRYPQELGRLEKTIADIARRAPDLLSAPNAWGNTPLHYSTLLATSRRAQGVESGDDELQPAPDDLMVDLTRLLLRSGASPAGVNRDGNSILHFMAPNLDRGDVAALFAELVRGDHGLDVNACNARGETPAMLLANHAEVLRRLCDEQSGGRCLAREAAAEGVAVLAALGADFGVADAQGNGLLHIAAADDVQLFKALMDCGGLDPMRENEAHLTAIDVAAAYNNNEILTLFERKV